MIVPIIIGVVVLILVIILIVLLVGGKPSGQELLEDRLGDELKPKKEKRKEKKRERPTAALGSAVDRAVEGRGFANKLATQLAQANMKWTVGEFLVLSALLSAVLAAVFYVLNRPVFIILAIPGGFILPRVYLGIQKNKRLKAFNSQLGDALNLMVNSLRAGYSTMQAMEVISKEMPPPISEEFGRVVLELQLGIPFDTAMENMLRRVPSADLDLIATAMSVQREVGGNLAEVLDSISFTIRERVRIKGEIKAMTAQGRITGYVITALPFGLGGFIYFMNPGYMGKMLEDPCGWAMLGTSLVMIVIGYVVMSKIVDIEV